MQRFESSHRRRVDRKRETKLTTPLPTFREQLNFTNTVFPETNLGIVFQLGSSQIPPHQEA